jgi:hypothetical protein
MKVQTVTFDPTDLVIVIFLCLSQNFTGSLKSLEKTTPTENRAIKVKKH